MEARKKFGGEQVCLPRQPSADSLPFTANASPRELQWALRPLPYRAGVDGQARAGVKDVGVGAVQAAAHQAAAESWPAGRGGGGGSGGLGLGAFGSCNRLTQIRGRR